MADARHAGRGHAGGRRGQCHQHGGGPGHRPAHAPHQEPAPGHRGHVPVGAASTFALGLEVAAFVELWLAREPFLARSWPSRPRSSTSSSTRCGSSAAFTEYRDRRSGGGRPRPGRLGRGDQLAGRAPVVLFAIIFIWTPPHFWALAVRYKEDYAAADVPMLPVVASMRRTTSDIVPTRWRWWRCPSSSARWPTWAGSTWLPPPPLGAGFLLMTTRLWSLARTDRATGSRSDAGLSATRSPTSRCSSWPWPATYSSQTTFTRLAVA